MAKRTTGGRKSKSSRSNKKTTPEVVESVAEDVTDEVTAKADEIADAVEDAVVSDAVDPAPEDPKTDADDPVTDEAPDVAADTDTPDLDPVEDIAAEATTETSDEIVYTTPAAAAAPVVVRKGGFVPMLLGGAVAAGLGYAAGGTNVLDPIVPESWKGAEQAAADLTPLTEQIESQSALIAALEEKLNSMPAVDTSVVEQNSTAIADISSSVEAVTGSFGTVRETVESFEDRLTALEKAPVSDAVSPEAIAAYERELAALSESVTAQREDVEKMLANAKSVEEDAEAAAQAAQVKLALSNVVSAIDSGDPFDAELAALQAAGGPDIPEALKAVADTGLPTLSALQDGFPDLARQALTVARAEAPADESGGGIGSFLQRSLGARSTTPREGDDPDAVLSRAEAALKDGDIETTLSEVDKLPDGSKTVLADWLAQAAARMEARAAADALSASLNTN